MKFKEIDPYPRVTSFEIEDKETMKKKRKRLPGCFDLPSKKESNKIPYTDRTSGMNSNGWIFAGNKKKK